MKFTSKSHACLSVILPNGASKHISFTEITGGGSVYYTSDETIANALRKHPRFGRLFKEVEEEPEVVEVVTNNEEMDKTITLEFATLEDAKDYFGDRYGISRSKMRTMSAVNEIAKNKDVVIVWKK